jgi:hypothetical protein
VSQETTVLLRMFYRVILQSKDLKEAADWAKTLMEEEDVAYVEKIIRDSEKNEK